MWLVLLVIYFSAQLFAFGAIPFVGLGRIDNLREFHYNRAENYKIGHWYTLSVEIRYIGIILVLVVSPIYFYLSKLEFSNWKSLRLEMGENPEKALNNSNPGNRIVHRLLKIVTDYGLVLPILCALFVCYIDLFPGEIKVVNEFIRMFVLDMDIGRELEKHNWISLYGALLIGFSIRWLTYKRLTRIYDT